MQRIIMNNGNITYANKSKVEKPITKSDFEQKYTFSCSVDTTNSDLKNLFAINNGVDCFVIRGTSSRHKEYRRYPRKMKKRLKKEKLARYGQKKTKLIMHHLVTAKNK